MSCGASYLLSLPAADRSALPFVSSSVQVAAQSVRCNDPYLPPEILRGIPKEIILYQYEVCPFCCKVKAFLDYHKVGRLILRLSPVLAASAFSFNPGQYILRLQDVLCVCTTDSLPHSRSEPTDKEATEVVRLPQSSSGAARWRACHRQHCNHHTLGSRGCRAEAAATCLTGAGFFIHLEEAFRRRH